MKKQKLLLLAALPLIGVGLAACEANDAINPKAGRFDKFISKVAYTDKNAYCDKAQRLNREIAEEGMVLLKNQDNVLPFTDVEKISVFGKASTDLQLGGGGSGAGNVSSGITKIDLQKSLTDAGYQINPSLTNFYNDKGKSGNGRTNGNSGWKGISEATIGETPIKNYDDTLISTFDEYGDAAIMVLARGGTEGADCKAVDARDNNSTDPFTMNHYLQLSQNESDLLDMIEEHFDKVVILINSGNIYQCDRFEEDDGVSAVIWMGTPGANGTAAIGEFLNGSVNPSGKTVDTWARDFTKDPVFQNFSDNAQTNVDNNKEYPADTMFNPDGTPVRSDGTYKGEPEWDNEEHKVVKYGLNGVRPSQYVSYEEGIYFDYRYYETAYADMAKDDQDAADEWYAGEDGVIYPFGYGLSYTTFEQKVVSCNYKDKTINRSGAEVKLSVKVQNTGDVTGKDVVQVYWKAPYYDGGIEKPYEVLCAFAKTKMLEPGESQTLDLSFIIQDLASYDYTDANENDFTGYELEGGNYEISINKDAHNVYETIKTKIPEEGFQYPVDRYTGNEVVNRFTDAGFYSSLPGENDVGFDHMSRSDFDETFPTHPTEEDRTLKEGSRVEEFFNHKFNIADLELNDDGEYIPLVARHTKEEFEENGWSQQATTLSAAESIQFSEMVGLDLDDPKWDEFINDCTYKEIEAFCGGGNTHNPAISRCGKPSTSDSDGPSKFGTMWWCGAPIVAATFNIDLAREQGDCVGIEGHMDNKYGWAGPGVNLHRSPFGGRNFEYYSADPFLTGRISGRVVAGATDKGIYCYFKHFAVNDQEKGRESITVYVSEQALREVYLKPFQMVVQEGKTTGIMSSYNRLGLMETAASYPLLTEVLRNEWGFVGSIISDMTHNGNSAFDHECYENINNRVLAGCNNQLDGSDYLSAMNAKWDQTANDGKGAPVYTYQGTKYESYSWWYAIRECAKQAMWICANCGAMDRTFAEEAEGVTFTNVVNGFYNGKIDEEVNIEVNVPDTYAVGAEYNGKSISDVTLELDDKTPLPEGLTFDNGVISGTPEERTNQFVHILIKLTLDDDTEVVLGASFELFVPPVIEETVIDVKEKKGGCGGSIAATSGIIALLSAVGACLLFTKKKEE